MLRQNIRALTNSKKVADPHRIARTFSLIASPTLFHLEEWYKRWFPLHNEELAVLYPWLLAGSDDVSERDVARRALVDAFDADRVQTFTLQGFNILDNINQVLVIADLSHANAVEQTSRVVATLKEEIQLIKGVNTSFRWMGIFVLKNPIASVAGVPVAEGKEAAGRNTARKIELIIKDELLGDSFDRVFFLDNRNEQGTVLAQARDINSLVVQLIYFLTNLPASVENSNEYIHWLQRSRAYENRVSGTSAFSMVLPIDQIVEAASVAQGASILDAALLDAPRSHRSRYYASKYLTEEKLTNPQTLKAAFESRYEEPDPLQCLPHDDADIAEFLIGAVRVRDSLDGYAKSAGNALDVAEQSWLQDLPRSLESYIDSILMQEPGGITVAVNFANDVSDHLKTFQKALQQDKSVPDPSPSLQVLEAWASRAPASHAIFARTIVLIGLVLLFVLVVPLGFVNMIMIGAASSLLAGGAGLFYNHASARLRERHTRQAEQALRASWSALVEREKNRVAGSLVEGLLAATENIGRELGEKRNRVRELTEYYQTVYLPALPEGSALWKYVVSSSDELLQFRSRCATDMRRMVSEFIQDDRPYLPWRRFGSPGDSEPNSWEGHVIEAAALRALPSCRELINLSVLDCLEADNSRTDAFKTALIRGAQPFLVKKPGAGYSELNAVLEADPTDDNPVIADLRKTLDRHFKSVKQVRECSPYRLTFFGFVDGVALDDVAIA